MKVNVSKKTYFRLGASLCASFCGSTLVFAAPFDAELPSRASVGFEHHHYFESPSLQNFPTLTLDGRGVIQKDAWEGVGDAEMSSTLNRPRDLSYVFVRDAYVGHASSQSRWSIGRKKLEWSILDEHWKLGVYQPRLRWDYVRPQTGGLTGVFFEQKAGSWFKMTLFGSPVFVPEQGAPFSIEQGRFSTSSPWFSPPLSSLDLFGRSTPVYYSLHMPAIRDIVFQPSWGVSTLFGKSEGGPWARFGYAQKPVNQIFVDYQGALNLSALQAEVDLYPRVAHHHVVSAESGVNTGSFRGWIGAVGETPTQETPSHSSNTTRQTLATALAAGPGVEWVVWGESTRAITAHASYVRLWGGLGRDQGPLAPQNGSAFESRYPFQNAVNLGLKAPLSEVVTTQGQMIYDTSQKAAILSGSIQYQPSLHWRMRLGADLLGVEPLAGAPRPAVDMIRRYQTNDRVYGGVTYVF